MRYVAEIYLSNAWEAVLGEETDSLRKIALIRERFQIAVDSELSLGFPVAIVGCAFAKSFSTPSATAPEWAWWSCVDVQFETPSILDCADLALRIGTRLPDRTHIYMSCIDGPFGTSKGVL